MHQVVFLEVRLSPPYPYNWTFVGNRANYIEETRIELRSVLFSLLAEETKPKVKLYWD